MFDELFSKNAPSVDKMFEPSRRFHALMLNGVEKVAHFQLDAVKSYTELGLKNLREGLELRDVNDIQGFVTKQGERARELGEKVQSDVQTLAGIQQELGTEMQKLMQNNVAGLSEAPRAARSSSSKSSGGASSGGSSSSRKSA